MSKSSLLPAIRLSQGEDFRAWGVLPASLCHLHDILLPQGLIGAILALEDHGAVGEGLEAVPAAEVDGHHEAGAASRPLETCAGRSSSAGAEMPPPQQQTRNQAMSCLST